MHLICVEHGNPNRVHVKHGKLTVRKATSLVGTGRAKKRRLLAERRREHITGQIGKYPSRKVADVALVNHPKNDVKVTHRGKIRCRLYA